MRSRDNLSSADADFESDEPRFRLRSRIEHVLHGVAVVLILFLIWQAFRALRSRPESYAAGKDVQSELVRWTTRQTPSKVHVAFDSVPTPALRDWVAAFPGAGTTATWEGVSLRPSAISVEPVADPKNSARIWVSAPSKSVVSIGDKLGKIDSLEVEAGGGVLTVPNVEGAVRATVNGTSATSVLRDSLAIKPVLVLAIASWEGKFVAASLEEHGWKVDSKFILSPKVGDVLQNMTGDPQIDTSKYAAVIALDTSAQRYAGQIEAYVRKGGGFIAAGEAAAAGPFAAMLPGKPGVATDRRSFDVDSLAPRKSFSLSALTGLKPDAVPIEMRDSAIAVAARRVGQGRVLQVGYHDTWRWRMGGMVDPVGKYRNWWNTMVGSVAYAPRSNVPVTASIEPTPMASLVSILGAPTPTKRPDADWLADKRLLPVLFGILMALFLVEWASRRLRGQP